MVAASELTFGVEIETHVPAGITTIGGYHHGLQVAWLPEGWKAESDSSIRTPNSRRACEFVSPILKGIEGVQQLKAAIEEIDRRGAKVNDSCGIHVTVGFNGDAAALGRLVNIVASFEAALYAMTGTHSRENGNSQGRRYCDSIKQHGNKDAAQSRASYNRYHLLNLTHIAAGKPRVEFRVFSGTTNPVKILAWVAICLGMVERALNGSSRDVWDSKNKLITEAKNKGAGNLRRMFCRLDWRSGVKVARKWQGCFWHGEAAAMGLPAGEQLKKELQRLAKKYDKETAASAAAAALV